MKYLIDSKGVAGFLFEYARLSLLRKRRVGNFRAESYEQLEILKVEREF